MKTVVTGGTGFIGGHLVKSLLDKGRDVIVTSALARLGNDNLTNLGIKPGDIGFHRADLSDYPQALKAIRGADIVYHMAARVGSLEYLHSSEMAELVALQTNLAIDANVFRACLETGVKKLIYASSCAVYQMDRQFTHGTVFYEDDLKFPQGQGWASDAGQIELNPDGGYGWAKVMGEIELGWMHNIDIGIARIFNIYGVNEPLGERANVIADLICKAILHRTGEYLVRGDGKQSRDFLYVSDCVEALLKLEEKVANPPVTVNIGSGIPISIGTIAQKVVALSGKDIKVKYDNGGFVGPISRMADISRARTLLGWQQTVDLDSGLALTYAWTKKELIEGVISPFG